MNAGGKILYFATPLIFARIKMFYDFQRPRELLLFEGYSLKRFRLMKENLFLLFYTYFNGFFDFPTQTKKMVKNYKNYIF